MRAIWLTCFAFMTLAVAISWGFSAEEAESYSFALSWPSDLISRFEEFRYPTGIAVDPAGNVYVADAMNIPIRKFDSSGKLLEKWESSGSDDGEFEAACAVAVDSKGNIFVADSENNRIQKFDASGKFLAKWGEKGYREGQFADPKRIAVDSSGNVFVLDTERDKVLVFDSSGKFVMEWGTRGSADGEFDSPHGIAAGADGNVLIADSDNNRIQKYDPQGKFLAQWGESGAGEGEFFSPEGIAVDSKGNVFVTDLNGTVQKFDGSGKFLTKWGSRGSSEGYMFEAAGIAVDASGNVYVADTGNKRIQKFRPPASEGSDEPSKETSSEEKQEGSERAARKLTVYDVIALRVLDVSDEAILKQLAESGTVFDATAIEKLKEKGFEDDFISKLPKPEPLKQQLKKLTIENVLLLKELGIPEETILGKVMSSETVFTPEEVEQLQKAGFSEEILAKLPKSGPQKPKLAAENIVLLNELDLSEESILEKIEETGSTFSMADVEQFKAAGLSEKFVAKLTVKESKEEEKGDEKEKEKQSAKDGRAGSWQLKAAAVSVDLELQEDGGFSWHYKSLGEVEDLKGTWKAVDKSTIEVTEESDRSSTLVPCKLIDADTLQITVEGVILQFKRK